MQLPVFTIETDPAIRRAYRHPGVPPALWVHIGYLADLRAEGAVLDVPDFPSQPSGEIVHAFVNANRWMWRCPSCGVPQDASRADRRGWCPFCFGGGRDGWLTVVFPDDVDEIERVLMRRPDPSIRHWEPPETVDDLRRENVEHFGVGV